MQMTCCSIVLLTIANWPYLLSAFLAVTLLAVVYELLLLSTFPAIFDLPACLATDM